ncbi:hypothetical protein QTH91_18510 [Variovorax dokdonensis]|uniref:PXPV repeat-containing protein n=1 Tax=Variovorax dokdonensis TaxID=344883 RepID=A0ABT7NF87_9BURK|nr:hypothetical protein [Variovorax dokdonensis]MDM0046490.1 hypothetical protein [Variovorax dokdonensis]
MKLTRAHLKFSAALLLGAGALGAATTASAGVSWSVGVNVPGVYIGAAAPVYYPPAPVYYPPAPVYYGPPPVVYAPPVVVRPAGGYYGYGRPYYRAGYARGYYRGAHGGYRGGHYGRPGWR